MDMENIKPNSHKYREEQQKNDTGGETKKVEKVVKGTVKTRKKSEARKFADIFISEDAANVKSYILMDVLVPAVKKAISDIVTDGIDMILYGGSGRHAGRNTSSSPYISYSKYSERDRRDERRYTSDNRTRNGYRYDDIILDSRGEAEGVLARMDELIDLYDTVSVADLYDLVGITGNYTDNKYGWTNLRNAEVVRVRDGYLLKMPKPGPL